MLTVCLPFADRVLTAPTTPNLGTAVELKGAATCSCGSASSRQYSQSCHVFHTPAQASQASTCSIRVAVAQYLQ